MEMKRHWKSRFHRIAEWRTHKYRDLTRGPNIRREITTLVSNAARELIIIDLAREHIFSDAAMWRSFAHALERHPALNINLLLYAGENHDNAFEHIIARAEPILQEHAPHIERQRLSLYSIHDEPYILFYLNEHELLIKDILRGGEKSASLKFKGKNIFGRDCRDYSAYLIQTPPESELIFQWG